MPEQKQVQQNNLDVYEPILPDVMRPINGGQTDFTDLGNARAFTAWCLFNDKAGILFDKKRGWMSLDRTSMCWSPDNQAAGQHAANYADLMWRDALKMGFREDYKHIAPDYIKHAETLRRGTHLENMVKKAESLITMEYDFDSNPYLLKLPDTTALDLLTGEYIEVTAIDPNMKFTKHTAVLPGDKGRERWMKFLDDVSCGDDTWVDWMQQAMGMSLIGEVLEETLVVAVGCGMNGKSTFYEVCEKVMGKYAQRTTPELLDSKSGMNFQAALAGLDGARLLLMPELETAMMMSSSRFKTLTSRDVMNVRPLYRAAYDVTPTHTTHLLTNALPTYLSADNGTNRRFRVVPWDLVVNEEVRIAGYADTLFKECGPAVLAWMIDGARKFIANEKKLPRTCERINEATADYLTGNDVIQQFLDSCCIVKQGAMVGAREMYSCYSMFCKENAYDAMPQRGFIAAMEAKKKKKKIVNRKNFWIHIDLAP